MKKIDDELGGTTPLNIIIRFPSKNIKDLNNTKDDKDDFSEWDEDSQGEEDKAKYWFTRDKMDKILKVHDYLDSLPEIGKVLSFGSILRVAEDLNNKQLQSLEIAVLYSKIPDEIKKEIISPYISVEKDEARISVRVKDSLKNLRRDALIKKINSDINSQLGFNKEEYKLSGVLILFNNLLQSLFKSQILTLGIVMLGIFAMFLYLEILLFIYRNNPKLFSYFYFRYNRIDEDTSRYDDNYYSGYYYWDCECVFIIFTDLKKNLKKLKIIKKLLIDVIIQSVSQF